jgi:hypothetical protein
MKVNNSNFFQAIEILMDQVEDIKSTLAQTAASPQVAMQASPATLMHEPIDI